MNMVFASGVLVIASLDRNLVVSVCLTSRFVPTDIILAVLIRPGRNLNGPYAFRAVDIFNNDVKSSRILVVVLDCDRTSRTCFPFILDEGFLHKGILTFMVYIKELSFILTIRIFMITGLSCNRIRAIRLTAWTIPNNVLHPIRL